MITKARRAVKKPAAYAPASVRGRVLPRTPRRRQKETNAQLIVREQPQPTPNQLPLIARTVLQPGDPQQQFRDLNVFLRRPNVFLPPAFL